MRAPCSHNRGAGTNRTSNINPVCPHTHRLIINVKDIVLSRQLRARSSALRQVKKPRKRTISRTRREIPARILHIQSPVARDQHTLRVWDAYYRNVRFPLFMFQTNGSHIFPNKRYSPNIWREPINVRSCECQCVHIIYVSTCVFLLFLVFTCQQNGLTRSENLVLNLFLPLASSFSVQYLSPFLL